LNVQLNERFAPRCKNPQLFASSILKARGRGSAGEKTGAVVKVAAIERDGATPAQRPWRVLVVDDSRAQRLLLRASLSRWGYAVSEAASGDEALALARATRFDIVLSDWMMPGMSGLDLCRGFRALAQDGYSYFILLTSKSAAEEVARGLDTGADDFVAKPVSADELRARLKAGERILGMQRELRDKNRLLGAALTELQGLYDSLDRDLIEARKIQQSLVRDRHADFGAASVSLLLRPSGHVGGDLVGYFPLGPGRIAFFAVDVAGHGVAAAMMAARLAGTLTAAAPGGNVALALDGAQPPPVRPPEGVAARLNRLVHEVMQVDQYFTCIYAEADLATGRVALVQAGHPHPILLRTDGAVTPLGAGGLPVGLFPGARWERVEVRLRPGDRLAIVSDGFTECTDPSGQELGEDGLMAMLARQPGLTGTALLDGLMERLERFAGASDFADDLSAVLFAYHGPPG
jgi:sigma-B regulation protein RsbU (phosphoserine phosphatase)